MKGLANKIQDAFDNIKAEPQLVESTKQFLSEKRREKGEPSRRLAFPKALAAVCIALLLGIGIGGYGYSWVQAPVSYVAIDVNPSMELALNRFDKVVSVKAYNREGEEILRDLSLRGKRYTDAIDLIMASKAMEAYLTEKAELVFTVAADSSRESELKSGVEGCAGHSGHNSQSFSVDMEAAAKAHDSGLSLGKYYAWLQLLQYDDTVTVDDCRDMSMAEIHGLISEHEHDGEYEEESHEEEHQQEGEESYEEEHQQEGEESREEEHQQEEEESREEEHQQEDGGSHVEEHSQDSLQDNGNVQDIEGTQNMDCGQGLGEVQERGQGQGAGHASEAESHHFGNGAEESSPGGHHREEGHRREGGHRR